MISFGKYFSFIFFWSKCTYILFGVKLNFQNDLRRFETGANYCHFRNNREYRPPTQLKGHPQGKLRQQASLKVNAKRSSTTIIST